MKNILFLIFFSFLNIVTLYSQWRSIDIPDSIKRNADVVIRRDNLDVIVSSSFFRSKIVKRCIVTTILNERAKEYASFHLDYEKGTIINVLKGTVYNELGKVVRRFYPADFNDVSMVPGETLFDDNRARVINYEPASYPLTIEFEYEISENSILSLPIWRPISDYRMGVENASLRLTLEDSSLVRYKTIKLKPPVVEKVDGKEKVLLWDVKNLKPIERESFSPNWYDFLPVVYVAPLNFSYEGYKGNMLNWQKYGEWVDRLLIGRQELSPKTKPEIIELTKNENDTLKKIRLVYKYLQSHTRYISIQLGIGGFQPFPASDVEKYGYGDCKALTNYTRSLLSVLGIKSYYCEIGVSHTRISFDDFPSINQTDHVILCVPNRKDTIWLECTNQNSPFGFVSHEKINQKAILVDGENSKLVNLPRSNHLKDKQLRVVNVFLDTLGSAKGEILTQTFGAEIENLMPELWTNDKDRLDELRKKYRATGIKFNSFEYAVNEDGQLSASERVSFEALGYASRTGKRMFVPIKPFSQTPSIPAKQKTRINDLSIFEGFLHSDTTKYNLPKGYSVEFLPKPKNVKAIFGEYSLDVSMEGEKVIVIIRRYVLNRGLYASKEFNNFIDFLNEIAKVDKQSIVLVSKK